MCARCVWLQQRVENLTAKVQFLGDELGIANRLTEAEDLRLAAGLKGGTESRILLRLYKSCKVLTKLQLADELEATEDPTAQDFDYDNTVSVFISKLRKQLPVGSIGTCFGYGYRLSSVGRSHLEKQLEKVHTGRLG